MGKWIIWNVREKNISPKREAGPGQNEMSGPWANFEGAKMAFLGCGKTDKGPAPLWGGATPPRGDPWWGYAGPWAGKAVPHRHKLGRHVDRTCGSARSPLGRGRERNRESGGRLGRGLLMAPGGALDVISTTPPSISLIGGDFGA